MDTSNSERIAARIKLWCLRSYIGDLEAYRDGDVNRFGRMVGSGGTGLGSDSAWRGNVSRLAGNEAIKAHCGNDLDALMPRIKALGIEVNA